MGDQEPATAIPPATGADEIGKTLISGVGEETTKGLQKRVADWIVERIILVLAGSGTVLLAILAFFHSLMVKQIAVPVWKPLLLFGTGGAIVGGNISFWLTRRTIKHLRKALDGARKQLGEKTLEADTDPITGISNARACQRTVGEQFEEARNSKQPLTVIIIDLDDFKRVNDKSNVLGDKVLREFAINLRKECRGGEPVFRYKVGDEFLVMARNTKAEPAEGEEDKFADGGKFANRLRNFFNKYAYKDSSGEDFLVTISAGVADANPVLQPGDTPEALLRRAEAALRKAKQKGKGTYELYQPGDESAYHAPPVKRARKLASRRTG